MLDQLFTMMDQFYDWIDKHFLVILLVVAFGAFVYGAFRLVRFWIEDDRSDREIEQRRRLRLEQVETEAANRSPEQDDRGRVREAEDSVRTMRREIRKLRRMTRAEEWRTLTEAQLAKANNQLEAAKSGYVRPRPSSESAPISARPLTPELSHSKVQALLAKAMNRIDSIASSEREQAWSDWEAEIETSYGPLAAQEIKQEAAKLRSNDCD